MLVELTEHYCPYRLGRHFGGGWVAHGRDHPQHLIRLENQSDYAFYHRLQYNSGQTAQARYHAKKKIGAQRNEQVCGAGEFLRGFSALLYGDVRPIDAHLFGHQQAIFAAQQQQFLLRVQFHSFEVADADCLIGGNQNIAVAGQGHSQVFIQTELDGSALRSEVNAVFY